MSIDKKIKVKVIPRSSFSHIEEDLEGNLRVKLKSAPVKGQANQALIEMLAKYYKVSKTQIRIIQGLSSRNKIIKINKTP
ncbi:MAG: hypothetical protein COU22_03265 [Candidatus Komeilibacteria bacterium CG10_big_fil_rev_8_21_14_0_10_41_13]|uniref:UPF0235 protein COU22_03265 n=1 Tax=Candidatus Komeilibacteria bacterium CG10_big_fil_rev_8_21_14_0_10_41_13 TaxID=1974476 RepID=A0A2M6WBR3_9BACT|nr:MAG: hypothetical protein COU22_03265 [Candidatus Komeilibacteria bacterium CG10_big_fil_rev_8_21_14_0_10_41_13]